jgi:hypothetical protein
MARVGEEEQEWTAPPVKDVIVRSNTASQNLSFQISASADVPTDQYSADHNMVGGFTNNPNREIYGTDYAEESPKFVNSAVVDFHLVSGSPAMDGGLPEEATAEDYDVALRPLGGRYEIEASEFHSS